MYRLSHDHPEFVANRPNRQKRKRFQLRLDKLDRIASGLSETVDAVLALLVPGNEATAKRRKEQRGQNTSESDSHSFGTSFCYCGCYTIYQYKAKYDRLSFIHVV